MEVNDDVVRNFEKENTDNAYDCDMVEIEIQENVQKDDDCEQEQIAETSWADVENVNTENKLTSEKVPNQERTVPNPDVIAVFCTATLENCPDYQVNEYYCQSIRWFLGSEQHLKENIISSELHHVATRFFRNNLYTNTLSIVVYVRTARLWESPC